MMDPAFRQTASGLHVPAPLSREREVWTRDEHKLLDRVSKLLKSRGIELFIGCTEKECRKDPISKVSNEDGTITLRCHHKDRVMSRQR